MTHVSYNTCDGCGTRDNPSQFAVHYAVTDVNGAMVAHLCGACVLRAAPRAQLAPATRPSGV